jgi:hypothetical protein
LVCQIDMGEPGERPPGGCQWSTSASSVRVFVWSGLTFVQVVRHGSIEKRCVKNVKIADPITVILHIMAIKISNPNQSISLVILVYSLSPVPGTEALAKTTSMARFLMITYYHPCAEMNKVVKAYLLAGE